jgi:TonB family protein
MTRALPRFGDRPLAWGVSIVLHAALLWLGRDALDARPQAEARGEGARGDLEIVAISDDQARELVARSGRPRVPRPIELVSDGPAVDRAASGPDLVASALTPSQAGGAELAISPPLLERQGRGALEGSRPANVEFARRAGASEAAGSAGLVPVGGGGADGDGAPGVDVGLSDSLFLSRRVPDYSAAMGRRDRQAGILERRSVVRFLIDDRGQVERAAMLLGSGDPELDARLLEAVRSWRLDLGQVARAHGPRRDFDIEVRFRAD